MSVNNPWLNPFQRSYNSIKSKLIDGVKLNVPEITNFSEGNIFVILISMFSAIAEVLHYYIDNLSRESIFITARKYSSLLHHSRLYDYRVKGATPSMVDIVLTLSTGARLSTDVTINAGTEFTSKEGTKFLSTKTVTWKALTYGVKVPVVQKEQVEDIEFGEISSEDVYLSLGNLGTGNYYVDGSLNLTLNNNGTDETWTEVDTFAYSNSNSKHFKVVVDEALLPRVLFGNGVYGKKPTIGSVASGTFYVTKGLEGNIQPGSLISVPSSVSSQHSSIVCSNTVAANGGSNYEGFDQVKQHLPLSLRTMDAAVTLSDYEALAMLVPGVDKAKAINHPGKYIYVYITPDGGGEASTGLTDLTKQFLLSKKLMSTSIKVLPTLESKVIIEANITGKKSFKVSDIYAQVISALIDYYSYENSDINKVVRLSDIYALIDNQSMVEHLTIVNLYVKPIALPMPNNNSELNWDINLGTPQYAMDLLLVYSLANTSMLIAYNNGALTGVSVPVDGAWHSVTVSGQSFGIKVSNPTVGNYSNNNQWSLKIFKSPLDQTPPDFTIPVFTDASQASLSITEKV